MSTFLDTPTLCVTTLNMSSILLAWLISSRGALSRLCLFKWGRVSNRSIQDKLHVPTMSKKLWNGKSMACPFRDKMHTAPMSTLMPFSESTRLLFFPPQGYEYVEMTKDDCCGRCVQTHCILKFNSTETLVGVSRGISTGANFTECAFLSVSWRVCVFACVCLLCSPAWTDLVTIWQHLRVIHLYEKQQHSGNHVLTHRLPPLRGKQLWTCECHLPCVTLLEWLWLRMWREKNNLLSLFLEHDSD